jgi:uncharacterized membrane protein
VSLQLAVRFLHVLAAITWIGGMLFIALVLVPVTRGLEDAALRRRLVQAAGRRFRVVGWVALAVLVATGLVNLALRPELLGVPRFWVKAALVAAALVLSAVHDFVLGPRAGRPDLHPSARAQASWLARAEILVVLAIVALGLALRG